ncbi:MAG: DUF2238 domain-containing protein [Myxococcota bacterium]
MQAHPARYPALLLGLFLLEFVALGVNPVDRPTWVLENMLSVALVVGLVASYRRFPFSRASYTMMFLFLVLHEIGSHYTYSLVPYDALWQRLFGFSLDEALGFERNHFDRAIHLAYGLFFAYPIREIFLRVAVVRGFWGYALPLATTMSTSMIYELIEWGAAVILGGDLGHAYCGTQGDVWDAHQDMSLATLGAVIAMGVTLAINRTHQRDFAAEWADSLRVKRPPL